MSASSPAPTTASCTHAIPCLTYRDANAAIAWLVRVLGADARHVYPAPDGTVAHAELWFGGGCVMLGSAKSEGFARSAGEGSVYVVVGDAQQVDALHDSAVAAGATIAISLRDTDYGSHDFACLDPEGNFWGFGTYAPAPVVPDDAAAPAR